MGGPWEGCECATGFINNPPCHKDHPNVMTTTPYPIFEHSALYLVKKSIVSQVAIQISVVLHSGSNPKL